MKQDYTATDEYVRAPLFTGRYLSWSAIAAGLVVALVCQILLTMLGVSIGAATINPTQESNPAEGLGVGAGIWWFVTGLVSLFVGAYVAGRVSGVARKKTGALHGFLMWCTATALTFMVAGTVMGGMFGTGFSALSGAVSNPQNRSELMSEIEEKTDQMGIGEQSRNEDVNRTGSDIRTSPATPYDGRGATGDDEFDTASRDAARRTDRTDATDSAMTGTTDTGGDDQAGGNTNLLNRDDDATATTEEEDRPVIGSQTEAEAREAGEKAAGATAKAALLGMLALLIGAGVCTWAGSMGVPHAVPPRAREARVPTGAIPGEPVKG
jgi:hypothetical protein